MERKFGKREGKTKKRKRDMGERKARNYCNYGERVTIREEKDCGKV